MIIKVLIIAILSLLVVLTAIYFLLKDKIQYNKAFNEESFCIVPALEMYYEISDYAPAKERIELLTPILEYSGDYSDSKGQKTNNDFKPGNEADSITEDDSANQIN